MQRPQLFQPKAIDPAFVLVTGADKSHAKSLVQLLTTIRRHEPRLKVVVYDLGLSRIQRWNALQAFPCQLRKFRYDLYPPFLDIRVNRGEYAWKPVLINEVAAHYNGIVCWMDAGNMLVDDLSRLRAFVHEHGFYSPRSSGTVANWTHPGMLDWLGVPDGWDGAARRNLNAACVAFKTSDPKALAVITEWGRLALMKECISPLGSSRKNHRQDQALLTILAYRSGLLDEPSKEMLGFRTHADSRLRRRPVDGEKICRSEAPNS